MSLSPRKVMTPTGKHAQSVRLMAERKKTAPVYVFPNHPDDPTLGGAIPAELFERLQGAPPPPPADVPDVS